MSKRNVVTIVTLACSILLFNTFGIYATSSTDDDDSLSINQMEELKKANQEQIDELQKQIEDAKALLEKSEDNQALQEEYQSILNDKISLQEENISYIEEQLTKINSDIDSLNDDIDYLENQISALELNIETNLDQFKKRLRATYISGNDSVASILVGSTDFFDVLCRMEFMARISSHDNALMETLKSQMYEYDENKKVLDMILEDLQEKQDESTQKRDEFSSILEDLSSDYQNSQDELDKIALEQEALNVSIEDLQKYQKEQEEEDEKIQKAIEEYYIQSSISESESISESISVSESESVSVSKSISSSVAQSISESVSNSIAGSVAESIAESIHQSEEESRKHTTTTTLATTPQTVATTQNSYANNTTSGFFNWPVPNVYTITDYYGVRTWNSEGMHYGLDISGTNVAGSDIVSAESGTVILVSNNCTHNYGKTYSCGCGGGYGNYVLIDHGNGYVTLYGHCQSINVTMGQTVQRGQVIAQLGSTGYSTGFHLHFEVRKNGDRVDPLPYLS